MATADDIDAPMTLEVDGTSISPEKFVRAVTAFFEVVREVSPHLDSGMRPEWHVQVKAGSNLIGAYPTGGVPPAVVDHILSVVGEGVDRLEREARDPLEFNEKALGSLRKLGQIAGNGRADDTVIRIWIGKQKHQVTNRTVANVTQLLDATFEEYGCVAGRLQTITERGGLRFVVYEQLLDRQVRCTIPERLVPEALDAFRKRVEIYGNVRYRRDGAPFAVFVRDIEVMPEKEDLPSIEDVRGIMRAVDF